VRRRTASVTDPGAADGDTMSGPTQHEHVWTDWVRPAVFRDSLGVVIGSPGLHVRLSGTDGPATPGWWRTCRTCPAEETVAASRAVQDIGAEDRAYDEGAADALYGVTAELMDGETVTVAYLRAESARLRPALAPQAGDGAR
jgi:hypothetical protein